MALNFDIPQLFGSFRVHFSTLIPCYMLRSCALSQGSDVGMVTGRGETLLAALDRNCGTDSPPISHGPLVSS